MTKNRIDLPGFIILLVLTQLWGLNYVAIKISYHGFSPVFVCFLRSCIASAFGIAYCLLTREQLFHPDIRLLHGAVVGLLFGVEFICIYVGMLYTNVMRAAILVYLAPFVVALGAHLFLGERLTPLKIASMVLAFFGVYLVFKGKPAFHHKSMLLGDILEILAAVFWGATTLYIKKYLAETVRPIHTFLYQLVFSLPVLLIAAFLLDPVWITRVDAHVTYALIYQSVIVAFASYLVWFKLIHVYPVASLSVFTFLTPVFGVAAGAIFLKEDLTKGLLVGLACVCLGIYGSNYGRREAARKK